MHNPNFMLQLLVNLALHYPQAARTPAQLQVLAEDWADDLSEFSAEIVERAVKRYRRESPYFPTVADIWSRCDELRCASEAQILDVQGLTEKTRTQEEQITLNNEWCAKILSKLHSTRDVRRQGRQDMPLDKQLHALHAMEAAR